ncbi:shikimate kinase [Vagococcus acidifermentans]|uniref:Shikimate kinase n=1 Tax=Vagococcus acidifermentans TaxID=564710 RepID=A0A430AN12_9ENTE|nr:shikimate kinase [Vagococcus acidifermentans]RSU09307.1 shikimate kinase [Vagococcus acidifermentans]
MKSLILIGFMGAGKTTVGKLLANTYNLPFIDMDAVIENDIGMTIDTFFEKYGEAAFRKKEQEVLADLMQQEAVIATGGGIVTSQANRTLLKSHPYVVFLKADPAVFLQRIKSDIAVKRPLASEKSDEAVRELYESRLDYYLESATVAINTDDLTPEEVVLELTRQLHEEGD